MANARQKEAWHRGALFAAFAHFTMAGESIDPMKLVPENFRPEAKVIEKTKAQKRHATSCALKLMGSAFGDRSS